MKFVLGGVVALLVIGCGAETGRTQAQRQADAYVAAFRTQTGKVFKLGPRWLQPDRAGLERSLAALAAQNDAQIKAIDRARC
jgi:hypothetical protein